MIISTKKGTPKEELEKIVDKFEKQGLDVTLITGKDYNVFGLVGDTTKIDERDVLANPWIDNVTRVSAPYKRANRLFHPADSVIDCGGVKIGSKEKIAVMAGPCSIENAEQALRIAQGVKAGGAALFRGGAYKPRTSPYAFQGLETEGILDMVKAREATGLPIVSELMSEDRIPEFEEPLPAYIEFRSYLRKRKIFFMIQLHDLTLPFREQLSVKIIEQTGLSNIIYFHTFHLLHHVSIYQHRLGVKFFSLTPYDILKLPVKYQLTFDRQFFSI